jgi:hypothetical protein
LLVRCWLACLLHPWTNRTDFFIYERMKHSSSSSMNKWNTLSLSMDEWNVLLLHLWMNGTHFFFIYERMERTFSSSLWTNGMHFFLIYEWMEHTSSSMDKWITVIDLHTEWWMDVWMDGWYP